MANKSIKIWILWGSFNPPTIAHLELSKQCIKQWFCDKVIWVPVNDRYNKPTNINSNYRIDMIKIALKDEKNIGYSLHELKYNRIVKTIESLNILKSTYPNNSFSFIAWADNLKLRWMKSKKLLSDFWYILINRWDIDCLKIINNSKILTKYKNKINIINYSSNISSTIVRNEIKEKWNSKYIQKDILKYIKDNNLFLQ